MPPHFLLLGFPHQAQQFFLVRLKEFTVLPRDLLYRVCGPHSHQRIWRPQACNQPRKKVWLVRYHCRDQVSAAERPPISSFQERQDTLSEHWALLLCCNSLKEQLSLSLT